MQIHEIQSWAGARPPFLGHFGGAMVFPAVTQFLTNSSHPRSRNLMRFGYRRCASEIVPFLDQAAGARLEETGSVVLQHRCQSLAT